METRIWGGQNGPAYSTSNSCNGDWQHAYNLGHDNLAEFNKKMVFDQIFRVIEFGFCLVVFGFSLGVVLALLISSYG